MVFVTGNYDLTVRRVAKALKGENCWLLVCNSRGINIWCSSLAGHFGTDDIIAAIGITGLAKKVEQRKLILPQLCASNVSVRDIERKTGFSSCFGPIYISRINDYLKKPDRQELRLATFNLKDRVEMAIGCPILLVIVLVSIYNFIGLGNLLVIIPVIYLSSVVGAVIYPNRFIGNIMAWSVATGAIVFAILYLFFSRLWHIVSFGNILAISLGLAYLVTEFSGWSPLIKYGLMPYKKSRISVDLGLCTGCGTCLSVCPRGVYEMKENSIVAARPDECVLCKACYNQCPVSAIIHSGKTITEVSKVN
jgi:NAD-dependent dihydropyrimidine dehydrogenase PreA subunit